MLVPQFAQHNAPTAARTFRFAAALTLASLSSIVAPALAAAEGDPGSVGSKLGSTAIALALSLVSSVAVPSPAAAPSAPSILALNAKTLLYVGHPEHALVPPVPSHLPSPGHVPPEEVTWGTFAGVAEGEVVGAAVLIFLLAVVEEVAVLEAAKSELGANGDGPTVLIGFEAPDGAADVVVAVDAAALLVLLFEGEVVRPSEEGRGICLVF